MAFRSLPHPFNAIALSSFTFALILLFLFFPHQHHDVYHAKEYIAKANLSLCVCVCVCLRQVFACKLVSIADK